MTDLDRIEFSMGRIEQLAGCSIITMDKLSPSTTDTFGVKFAT
jgi:hypothetical protein